MSGHIEVRDLTAYYGEHVAVADVSLTIPARQVTALIGPSGCGKSTVLRCLDGLHLTVPRARVDGEISLDGASIYRPGVAMAEIRQQIGMVFQRPNPFPTLSIGDNVLVGLRLGLGGRKVRRGRAPYDDIVEQALRHAGLWDEVKDRLGKPGGGLSGGQQQRLCIARALAVGPTVLLMDEPCSALDPISTLAIEDTIAELKSEVTIVIVTHNMQQAARVADTTAFMNLGDDRAGRLIEVGPTKKIFSKPDNKVTEDYVAGRFG
ncbi:phosphate ABC transporter ATP-binding protein, partial [Frankia sp. AgB1.9]|uniref:phosphate ABC transporter ATP-binding protein n=1 Tax=unclassified Frankia TaxID=2632575 RepID=UPI001931ECF3|nr:MULTISPECIES: phosphate ABC transporter ATP-binding protein [unclassified Frankia]MBL7491601.1 phosphate ABC transporter ATP-binding protein [Frankia sp. AgW1.1]MBL7554049.1 phosphate ABC transporter ATP-binding protein [Frankia sp. AgB1.9]MBL7618231.1 phosphate ABC transporter ATP-binding protein [Frankia sp. AgB1.8]